MSSAHTHDSLFHRAFSNLDNAAGQLRAVLPSEIADRIDWSTLKLEDGHYVDEQLADSQSDLLYTAKLAEHPIALYVLFEHQSTSDPWMAFRLLCYRVRIWRRWRDDHPEGKRLPAILPVVLSHAEGGWKAAMSMHELFDLPEPYAELLGPYLPQFRYVLDDLSERSDDELMARALGAMGLLALLLLRQGRDKQDFLLRLREWADLFRAVWQADDGREALGTLVRYAALANESVTLQDLSETLVPLLDQAAHEVVMTEGERLIRLGEARGEARGEAKGRAEGRAQAVLAIFAARGFNVSEAVRDRVVSCAHVATLDQWIARAATFDEIDKVFGE